MVNISEAACSGAVKQLSLHACVTYARLQPNSLDFLQIEGDHVHHLPDALFSVEWPWLMSNSIKLFNKTSYYVKTFIEGDHVQWTR